MLNVLLFYSTLFIVAITALVRNPVFAFVLYEAVYFFYPEQRWWGYMVPGISYSFFVVLVMIYLVAIKHKEMGKNKLLKVPQFRLMYFFLAIYGVAYFYAVLPELHYQALTYFFKLIIIISLAYKLCSTRVDLDYILKGYIFGAWYISFMTFQVGRNSGDRVEGIGTVDSPDSNGIAAAIAPTLVLCLYYFWTSSSWKLRALFALAGAFIANGLILINSRGAFLGVAVSLLVFMYHMFFSRFQRHHQKMFTVFIMLAGLSGGLYLADDSFMERMKSIAVTEVNEEKESGSTRTHFWLAAWEMAKDHPFGNGLKGFNYFAPEYIPEEINTGNSRNRSVHSTWFEVLAETGYLGLLVFISMLTMAYRALSACRKQLEQMGDVDEYFKIIALQSAFVGFLVAMSFIDRARSEILYWLILYTGCAYNIYVLKKDTDGAGINTYKKHTKVFIK